MRENVGAQHVAPAPSNLSKRIIMLPMTSRAGADAMGAACLAPTMILDSALRLEKLIADS
ncbi:MAG: hypothetical protein H6671_07340 [Anaerolineaceae bacterium]|nr:hypothetical protein [Anaerolineaceae bacterium]